VYITEGAVLGRNDCDEDGHSTDNTIEVIEKLTRDYNNLEYVTRDERWKDLEDLKNFLLDLVPPDNWVIINDADEIYKSSDLLFLREHASANPSTLEYLPLFLHFYRDFHHVLRPGGGADPVNITHQRIFFREEGDMYKYHPTVVDKYKHDKFFFPPFWHRKIFVKNMFIYHFGYCKGADNYTEKHRWYTENLGDFKKMSREKIEQIMNHPYVTGKDNPEDILRYTGDYPETFLDHPQFDTNWDETLKDMRLKDWRDVEEYDGAVLGPWYARWRETNGKSGDGYPYIQPP
jgi:hypothetical protein